MDPAPEQQSAPSAVAGPQLVDGKYSIQDLVDTDHLERVLKRFADATGCAVGLVDAVTAESLIEINWADICHGFHRAQPRSSEHCIASNLEMARQLERTRQTHILICEHGLIDGAAPIIIKGAHIADLYIGQVLFAPPDEARFRAQAAEYGYDEEAYLAALRKVSVVDEARFLHMLDYTRELASMVAETGLMNLQLKQSRQRYRSLMEQTREPIILVQDFAYAYVNQALCRLLGYDSAQEVVGRPIEELIAPEFRDLVRQRVAARMAGADVPWRYEIRMLHREGHEIWVEVSAQQVMFDDRPAIETSLHDISERRLAEEALRESEDRFRSTFEQAAVGMAISTVDGKLLKVNRAYAEMLGYTEEELLNLDVRDLTHPDDLEDEIRTVLELIGGRRSSYLAEKRYLARDGGTVWCLLSLSIVRSVDGEALYVIGQAQNITARKRAEEQLRRTERRLASVLNSLSDVVLYETGGGREFVSENIFDLLGVSAEELAADRSLFPSLIHPDDQGQLQEKVREWHQAGEPGVLQLEFRCHRADGSWMWFEDRMTQLKSEAKNDYMAGVLVDVTKRKEAEEALRRSEERYRSLVQNMVEGLAITERDGAYILANPACERLFGVGPGGLIGRTTHEFLDETQLELFDEQCRQRHAGRSASYELRIVDARGKTRYLLVTASPRFDQNGEFDGAQALFQDITERKEAEEALRHSEQRYRTTIDAMADAIHMVDRDLRITLHNSAVERWHEVLGLGPEIDGRSLFELYPFLPEQICDEYEEVFRMGKALVTEEFTEVNGQEVITETRKIPVLENGEVARVVTVLRDITERKSAEQALAMERDLLYTLMDNVPDTVYFKDAHSRFTRVNMAQAEVLGLDSPRQALGRTDADFFTPEHAAAALADEQRIIETGEPLIGKLEHIRASGGDWRWVSTTKAPWRDGQGGIAGTFGISRDITELKHAEEALRDSEERYRRVFEGTTDMIIQVDEQGLLTYVNPTAARVLGMEPHDCLGRSAGDFVDRRDRWRMALELRRLIRHRRQSASLENRVVSHDGTVHDVLWTLDMKFKDDGSLAGVSAIGHDITERKRLTEQLVREERDESMVTLAGGIAHDFNNILTGVMGSASLLLDAMPASSDGAELCRTIITSAQRMVDLTNKLLAYARGGHPVPRAVNVNSSIRDTLTMLRSSIPSHVRVRLDLCEDLWPVEADPGQLHQVLVNLIVNATEAMPGGGALSIRTANRQRPEMWRCPAGNRHEPGDYVFIEVADTGHGMNEGLLSRIFEPFYSTKFQGRGLGLAAVKGVVNSHKGCVHAHSQPGQGARFHVHLPRTAKTLPESHAGSPPDRRVNGTVLLIDDEDIVRSTARRMLARRGFEVLLAASASEGLAVFRRRQADIDLVIFDMTMPQVSGRQLFTSLRELDPQVKAIATSGYDKSAVMAEFGDEVPDGFIQKPFASQALLAAMQEVLAN